MQKHFENISIALAGILQAITLISEIAKGAKINESAFSASINSIFQTNPVNTVEVFGSLAEIKLGLEKTMITLNPFSDLSQLNLRYFFSLASVQKKIFESKEHISTLTQRIEQVKKQADYFSNTHTTVIANLADIYMDIIQDFRFRFYVTGNKQVLSVKENMEKIRALLLAALRSTVLWRQAGGSRTQFIFKRKKIMHATHTLLKNITNNQIRNLV